MIKGDYATRKVFINSSELLPHESQRIYNHSPDGFFWGYCGSGPAQLALALLLEFCYRQDAENLYQQFKSDVIAALPQSDFELDPATVIDWLEKHGCKSFKG